jgi:excisionase family DNA binding protein
MKYYTSTQVAEMLGVTRMTIYNWIRRGKLPVKSMGLHYTKYITESDIPAFLRRK